MATPSQKRVTRAVEMARQAVGKPELSDIYLARFHHAMDELQDSAEREAVYDRCRSEGWYQMAAKCLRHADS